MGAAEGTEDPMWVGGIALANASARSSAVIGGGTTAATAAIKVRWSIVSCCTGLGKAFAKAFAKSCVEGGAGSADITALTSSVVAGGVEEGKSDFLILVN